MRVLIFGCLTALALAVLPLAAADAAGGCGPGWHPVPPHFTPWGHWVPGHCVPNHPWWW